MDTTVQNVVNEILVDQRGREAELGQEVRDLRRTIEVLKAKNAALPDPPEAQTHKIENLETAAHDLQKELRRRESEHDELIAKALTRSQRSSVTSLEQSQTQAD